MSDSILPPEIRNLPLEERIDLVEQIWDSVVDEEESFNLTDAQKRELERRIAAHQKSPDEGKTWAEVKRELQGE
ncbi:MAG: addiction module protein [Planctomycetaceae bacterium]|jgi:putative addiction module component (TIGR02574 family)|nr:addiction module protein [Planctomycetaceae bacterium]